MNSKTSRIYNETNDFIRCELKRKKITQTEAADYIGIRQDGFSRRLSGQIEWSFREVIKIYELLGANLWQNKKPDN